MLSVDLTLDGPWILSGSKDRTVQFWDSRSGVAQLMIQGHKNSGTLFEFALVASRTPYQSWAVMIRSRSANLIEL